MAADPRGVCIPKAVGRSRVAWDLLYPGPELPGDVVIWGYTGGVKAPRRTYRVRLTVEGGAPQERLVRLPPNPRIPEVTQADYQEQFPRRQGRP